MDLQKKKRKASRRDRGKRGEKLAIKHLISKGYEILDKNFESRYGEIDIIALDNSGKDKIKTLVFIEVKARWSRSHGSPIESITPWKLKRLVKTGQYYCSLNPKLPDSLRVDAVLIDFTKQKDKRIEIIKNITQ